MLVSGDVKLQSRFYLNDSNLRLIQDVDYSRKFVYLANMRPISETNNPTPGNVPIFYKTDYSFQYELPKDKYTPPIGYSSDYFLQKSFLSKDGNKIIFKSRVFDSITGESNVDGWSLKWAMITINHEDFSSSTIEHFTYNQNANNLLTCLNKIENKIYINEGGDNTDLGDTYNIQEVNLGTNSISDTGFNVQNGYYSSFININENEVLASVSFRRSGVYTLNLVKMNFQTQTYSVSSNFLNETRGSAYLEKVGNGYYKLYHNGSDNKMFRKIVDENLNIISELESDSSSNYNNLGGAGNLLFALNGEIYFSINGNITISNISQTTTNKPLFSGDSNGTNQTTKDKPLMPNL